MMKKYSILFLMATPFMPLMLITACAPTSSLSATEAAPSSIQKLSSLPDITTLYTILTHQAGSQAKFLLAKEAYQAVRKPFFFVVAHNGMALATVLFSPETDAQKILQFTGERLMDYGAQTLYAYASGATDTMLSLIPKTTFDLYIKPITLGSIGIIGMTIACSAIPSPFIASTAYSGFQGMTVSGGLNLAKNALSKGLESKAVKKAMRIVKKPESTLFKNAFIITGALGLIALTPLLLPYAGAYLESISTNAVTTYITGTMALSAALDALAELSKASTYITYYQAGQSSIESLKQNWQQIQNAVSTFIELNTQELVTKPETPTKKIAPPALPDAAPATTQIELSKKTWKESIFSFIKALNPFANKTPSGGDLDYYFVD
jgi:hypothetical protein